MKIKSVSSFKNKQLAEWFLENWTAQVSMLSGTKYERMQLMTSLGYTIVWGINASRTDLKTIFIFPGFRTSSLFWDLDNALAPLKKEYRIFLVETNGQPNLSDGKTPDIKAKGYGLWATEVMNKLSVDKAIIAGASFGALICLKLCMVSPEKVDKAILLNPGCLQPFSLSIKNLYYNLLPLISTWRKNVEKFLDNAVFYKDKHVVSPAAKKLIADYQLYAIREFANKAQTPYPMRKKELGQIAAEVYLLLGDKDILFPYKKSETAARRYLKNLKEVKIIPDTGHGIETSKKAMEIIFNILNSYNNRVEKVKQHNVMM